MCLYVYEPSWMEADDFDAMHFHFIKDSLEELSAELEKRGSSLVTRVGEVLTVFKELRIESSFQLSLLMKRLGML